MTDHSNNSKPLVGQANNPVRPEDWLNLVLVSKLSMTQRAMCLTFAWTADRHGNPAPAKVCWRAIQIATGLSQDRKQDRATLVGALGDLFKTGWVFCEYFAHTDGKSYAKSYELTLPAGLSGARS